MSAAKPLRFEVVIDWLHDARNVRPERLPRVIGKWGWKPGTRRSAWYATRIGAIECKRMCIDAGFEAKVNEYVLMPVDGPPPGNRPLGPFTPEENTEWERRHGFID